MDTDWAIERLDEWVKLANSARATRAIRNGVKDQYTWASPAHSKMSLLRERHDQVRRIVHQVMGYQGLPDLLQRRTSETIDVLAGIVMCQEAIGRLKTDAETREKLGSNAPKLSADQLHPDIWREAERRWTAGNYLDAVQRAATYLNASVQDETGRHDVSDVELMREAFSMSAPTPGKPRLIWPGLDSDRTVKSMRVGILNYSQGLFSAIRNISTHSTVELDPQVALEQLAALSVLARWIDECELVTVTQG